MTENEWKTAIREIKSERFAITLNVTSDLSLFLRAVRRDKHVATLYRAMLTVQEAFDEVLKEIRELSNLEIDRRYENPNDVALAALLLLVSLTDNNYGTIAADIVDRAPQCWYANKIARLILSPYNLPTSSTLSDLTLSKPIFNEMNLFLNPSTPIKVVYMFDIPKFKNIESSTEKPEELSWM